MCLSSTKVCWILFWVLCQYIFKGNIVAVYSCVSLISKHCWTRSCLSQKTLSSKLNRVGLETTYFFHHSDLLFIFLCVQILLFLLDLTVFYYKKSIAVVKIYLNACIYFIFVPNVISSALFSEILENKSIFFTPEFHHLWWRTITVWLLTVKLPHVTKCR